MFNSYITKKTYYPNKLETRVHEHKAPTDESVKLLHEMQEKAKETLLDRVSLRDNPINMDWFMFKDDDLREIDFRIRFKIGMIEESVVVHFSAFDWQNTTMEVGEQIVKAISTRMTEVLLKHIPYEVLADLHQKVRGL